MQCECPWCTPPTYEHLMKTTWRCLFVTSEVGALTCGIQIPNTSSALNHNGGLTAPMFPVCKVKKLNQKLCLPSRQINDIHSMLYHQRLDRNNEEHTTTLLVRYAFISLG